MTSLQPLLADLGPAIAELGAAAEREGRFVDESYRLLKARKVMSLGVPAELGGGGAAHAELCDFIRGLAHHCPSTSLAFAMHTHLVAFMTWRHRHGQNAAPMLSKIAQSQSVLVSTGAGDWVSSVGNAVPVEGGYRVTAHKRFASGVPMGDVAVTSAPCGDEVLHFALPLDQQGITVGADWDTLAMRATGSHTLHIDDVFVPAHAVSLKRAKGAWHPMYNVICAVAAPIYLAPYVGIAERASTVALEHVKAKRPARHTLPVLGQMQNALLEAQLAWRETVAGGASDAPNEALASRTLSCKTILVRAARACVQHAIDVVGGAALFKAHPLERLWRDVQAAPFHPLPEAQQLVFSGRVALGLSPIEAEEPPL